MRTPTTEMPALLDDPDLMLELLAIIICRQGGALYFRRSETLGPFAIHQTQMLDERTGEEVMKLTYEPATTGTMQ